MRRKTVSLSSRAQQQCKSHGGGDYHPHGEYAAAITTTAEPRATEQDITARVGIVVVVVLVIVLF
jgi:hypothetical protein